jgi:hypothetical protein
LLAILLVVSYALPPAARFAFIPDRPVCLDRYVINLQS